MKRKKLKEQILTVGLLRIFFEDLPDETPITITGLYSSSANEGELVAEEVHKTCRECGTEHNRIEVKINTNLYTG